MATIQKINTPFRNKIINNFAKIGERLGLKSNLNTKISKSPIVTPLMPNQVKEIIKINIKEKKVWALELNSFLNHVSKDKKEEILQDLANNSEKLEYLKSLETSIKPYSYEEALKIGEKIYNLKEAITSNDQQKIIEEAKKIVEYKSPTFIDVAVLSISVLKEKAIKPLILTLQSNKLNEKDKNFIITIIQKIVEENPSASALVLAKAYKISPLKYEIKEIIKKVGKDGYKAVLYEFANDVVELKVKDSVYRDLVIKLILELKEKNLAIPTAEFIIKMKNHGKLNKLDKDLLVAFDKVLPFKQKVFTVFEIKIERKEENYIYQKALAVMVDFELKENNLYQTGIYLQELAPIAANYLFGFDYIISGKLEEAINTLKNALKRDKYEDTLAKILKIVPPVEGGDIYLAFGKAYKEVGELEKSAENYIRNVVYVKNNRGDISDSIIAALKTSGNLWREIKNIVNKESNPIEKLMNIVSDLLEEAEKINPENKYRKDVLEKAAANIARERFNS